MAINIAPELERKLARLAVIQGLSVEEVANDLLGASLEQNGAHTSDSPANEEMPPALAEMWAKYFGRSQEERNADTAELLARSRPPRPLPEGKTLFDVVCGQWPGDETDEEVFAALERLS